MPLLGGCTVWRNVAYGSHAAQKLDIYRGSRKKVAATQPIVLVVHGGGWITGDKRERAQFCAALARRGYIVCGLNYRLAPKYPFPAGVTDILQALNWILENASAYGGNPNNLIVIGDSAGAHLASLAIAGGDNPELYGINAVAACERVQKLVLYYGIYDLRSLIKAHRSNTMAYLRALTGTIDIQSYRYADTASPIAFAKYFPPTLLIASEIDPLYPQTIELTAALKKAHVPYQAQLLDRVDFPRARHGFQSLPRSKAAKAAFVQVLDFLAS